MKVDRQLPDRWGGRKYEEVEVTSNAQEFKGEFKEWIGEQLEFKPSLIHNISDSIVWMGAGSVFTYVASGLALIGLPVVSVILVISLIGAVSYGVLVVAKSLPHVQFLIALRLVTFIVGAMMMVL